MINPTARIVKQKPNCGFVCTTPLSQNDVCAAYNDAIGSILVADADRLDVDRNLMARGDTVVSKTALR